ncbi:hAT family C-terminal dimerization region [Rhizoctonia solani]|uniref:HAT family C-terminal dimerization region n=1 Tax=Rhizoctonia solani TaxID=456999 RepID=A0A8H7LJ50_9AGAM|nr:hAT family C-terminal dimerization region [Rhizoctonia solani]
MPALSHAIDAGIAKLEDYVEKSRSLPAHALAMALNPSIRYFWIEKYWSSEEALKAKELVQEHLLQCLEEQEARRQNATQSTMVTVAHTASQAANGNLTRGHEAFLVNEASLELELSSNGSPTPSTLEHKAFLEQKVIPPEKLKGMTAIEFWKASWVSSERVFSLIRMTCTQSRNRISAGKVESLQILKHSLRRRPDVPLTVYTRTLNLMARHLDGALGDGAISTVPIDTEDLSACSISEALSNQGLRRNNYTYSRLRVLSAPNTVGSNARLASVVVLSMERPQMWTGRSASAADDETGTDWTHYVPGSKAETLPVWLGV